LPTPPVIAFGRGVLSQYVSGRKKNNKTKQNPTMIAIVLVKLAFEME
jgi:hypothetical protein